MLDLSQASAATGGGATVDVGDSEPNVSVRGEVLLCTAACCANDSECFQPVDRPTLVPLAKNGRNFVTSWYKAYPWLSVCTTRGKVFCLYCRYTENHGLLTFSKRANLHLPPLVLTIGRKLLRSSQLMNLAAHIRKLC